VGPSTHGPAESPRPRAGRITPRLAAAALAFASAAVPLAAGAPPAQAAASQEIVIPATNRITPLEDTPVVAGTTGFLHQQEGKDGYLWTDYATGASTTLTGTVLSAPVRSSVVQPADAESEAIAIYPTPGKGVDWYGLVDPHTGERHDVQLPPGVSVRGFVADKVLAAHGRIPTAPEPEAVLVDIRQGTAEPLPVTGLPQGAELTARTLIDGVADDQGALIQYQDGGGFHYGLLDAVTGVVTPTPAVPVVYNLRLYLTPDRFAWWTPGDSTMHWVPRDDPSATPRDFTFPKSSAPVTLVGDTVLTASPAPGSTLGSELTALPLDGGAAKVLLDHVASAYATGLEAADGSVLIAGGSGDDWAVRRFTQSAGEVSQKVILPLSITTTKSEVVGLSLFRGTLNTIADLDGALSLHQQDVGTTPTPTANPVTLEPAGMPSSVVRCATGSACVRVADGPRDGGVHYLYTDSTGLTYLQSGPVESTHVPGTGGQIRDASDEYVVVDGGSPKTQYIVKPSAFDVTRSRPVQAAAVWYDTLWSASTSSPGTLIAELNPDSATAGTLSRTVKTGVACVPTELQATARWLYWWCGDGKQAGVYDLWNGRGFGVPSGQSMLGDGYVVRHDRTAGELKLTDFHTGGPAAERTIADLPAGSLSDDRRITWTVDKYGGHIAYVDGEDRVHVLADGVADSMPVITRKGDADDVAPRSKDTYAAHWNGDLYLSRPVDSWELTIVNQISKGEVATFKGGALRGPGPVGLGWPGKGVIPDSGSYTWELTAKYDGGTLPLNVGSGVLRVSCGRLLTHVYDCDGIPDLLAVRSDGKTDSWTGLSGGLHNDGLTATWPATSTLVPIGDLNNDGYADLLVRDSTGNVRAYWGKDGQTGPSPSNTSAAIGTGWNKYNVLTSPGDLSDDGRADLVTRDTAGDLWLHLANDDDTFDAPVKIGSGQGGYTAMVGMGDLNGDGVGDLLARDTAGDLWRLPGADKRFAAKVKISSGFSGYNAFVGIGDLTQDGKNDLLARDTAGSLYLWAGTGTGGFGGRTTISTGWNTYKTLV